MNKLYFYPSKIFLVIAILTGLGLFWSTRLPVALYPNSSKPEFVVRIPLGNLTLRDFMNQYASNLSGQIGQIDGFEKISFRARTESVRLRVSFLWGVNSEQAEEDLTRTVEGFKSQLQTDVRDRVYIWPAERNSGFFAASIYSDSIPLDELYLQVEPTLVARVKSLEGVDNAVLWNPYDKDVFVTIHPGALANYKIPLSDLRQFLREQLQSLNAGEAQLNSQKFSVVMNNGIEGFSQIAELSLAPLGRPSLKLRHVADVELAAPNGGTPIKRTDGRSSLMLFLTPSNTGNLKAISEATINILKSAQKQWPSDTHHKILVDPSQYIQAAIWNVKLNILVGGTLAVFILMLFVGSLRSTIFSAIEIPLAIIWAFILMRIFDVSINLISLGGLALTAGMNIDASIVMVENIARHLKEMKPNSFKERAQAILAAVNEVRWPIVTSTLSTLIVFLPLAYTSGVAYAILGDLAKAVVFSHAFAAFVAILIVPTTRLYIPIENERKYVFLDKFNHWFEKIEDRYMALLAFLLERPRVRASFLVLTLVGVLSGTLLLVPHIRKEIIALPQTDSLWIHFSSDTAQTTNELAAQIRPYEQILKTELKDYVAFTYTNIWRASGGGILARLHDKELMEPALAKISELMKSSPELQIHPSPWNPSQLPLPDTVDLSLVLTGPEEPRLNAYEEIEHVLRGSRQVRLDSTILKADLLSLTPKYQTTQQDSQTINTGQGQVAEVLRTMFQGQRLGYVATRFGSKEVTLRFPSETVTKISELSSFPVLLDQAIVPLRALLNIKSEVLLSGIYRENEQEMIRMNSYVHRHLKESKEQIVAGLEQQVKQLNLPQQVQLRVEDPNKEVDASLKGLLWALGISLSLIAIILFFQFGRWQDIVTVMSAIPLGFLGVSLGLYAFDSTWSLNSLLGVIMLAGISVNNSILIMSFFHQLRHELSLSMMAAIKKAAHIRLRPIIITSLTTILAMMPIALGWGDGAKVLQPLGIAVTSGMVFSTLLTLFFIPCLAISLTNSRFKEST